MPNADARDRPGAVSGTPATAPASGGGAVPDELHPRHLLVRVAEIVAIIVVVVIAISALPGLDEVRTRLEGVQPIWIVAIALAEVGSCLGYLLVFRSTFCARMPWALSYEAPRCARTLREARRSAT